MSYKIGITGIGQFANAFIPLFKAHPLVGEVVIADLIEERTKKASKKFEIERTFSSHEKLCKSDVDAVAIFAQRHLHGSLTIEALNAGKHVYCAVPIASNLEKIKEIVNKVKETRLVYMNGETSYYYPHTIYCRERYKRGDFGRFVYGEGNYLHDMSHGFYEAFKHSGGEDWKKVAGIPPMYYPTHSTSMITSVTGARMTEVSCLGYRSRSDDRTIEGIYGKGANFWDNPFSNETALMRTSDGGMARINEFRCVGHYSKFSSNPLTIYGTKASFEENSGSQVWTGLSQDDIKDLTELLNCSRNFNFESDKQLHHVLKRDFHSGFSKVHPFERLPEEFLGLKNGHLGSHQFLVDDFIKALNVDKLPPINVWEAAKYCAPGLVAHESALKEGKSMGIPDFGDPPEDWNLLEPDKNIDFTNKIHYKT